MLVLGFGLGLSLRTCLKSSAFALMMKFLASWLGIANPVYYSAIPGLGHQLKADIPSETNKSQQAYLVHCAGIVVFVKLKIEYTHYCMIKIDFL